ncbi:MAG: hypothetical protein SPL89_10280 [Clostridia bacterium]|nr:hypothetical protein [Clostridia bacterium]
MDNNKIVFKTKFKGFDKKGVVDYIRNLSEKYDEAISAKQTEINNYKTIADELKAKNAELETRLSDLSEVGEELSRAKAENSELKEKNAELERRLSSVSSQLETDYIPDKERLEKEVEKLRAELDETRAQTERDKSEIADVLIKADKLAKKLQEEAVMAANARKAEIEKQIISKKSELLGISGEIERMKGVFQDLYTRYVDK